MSRLRDSIAEHVRLYRDYYLEGKRTHWQCPQFTICQKQSSIFSVPTDLRCPQYHKQWCVVYALVMDTKTGSFCFTRRFHGEEAKVLHSIDILSSTPERVMAHWDGFATEDATHPSQEE